MKIIAASVRFGVIKDAQLPLVALETKIEILRRPQSTDFGFALWVRIVPWPIR